MMAPSYRGIPIHQSEAPGSPFTWIDHEADIQAEAGSLEEAKRQIAAHFGPIGGPEPCPVCNGTGAEDWSYLGVIPCAWCRPNEKGAWQ